jgi:hypothetical protein
MYRFERLFVVRWCANDTKSEGEQTGIVDRHHSQQDPERAILHAICMEFCKNSRKTLQISMGTFSNDS